MGCGLCEGAGGAAAHGPAEQGPGGAVHGRAGRRFQSGLSQYLVSRSLGLSSLAWSSVRCTWVVAPGICAHTPPHSRGCDLVLGPQNMSFPSITCQRPRCASDPPSSSLGVVGLLTCLPQTSCTKVFFLLRPHSARSGVKVCPVPWDSSFLPTWLRAGHGCLAVLHSIIATV